MRRRAILLRRRARRMPLPAGARGFSVTIDPGNTANRRFVIANHSANLRLRVRLEPVVSSSVQASWVTLSDVVETLEPGAHALVSARVLVPSNAVPGSVTITVNACVEHAALAADGQQVAGMPAVATISRSSSRTSARPRSACEAASGSRPHRRRRMRSMRTSCLSRTRSSEWVPVTGTPIPTTGRHPSSSTGSLRVARPLRATRTSSSRTSVRA